ncbi:MAG: MBL fold metallo-hydrolase, partial [Chitinophagales bacterium]
MSKIAKFTFNPFQENTYVLYDESRECIIIDPGCSNSGENAELSEFIDKNNLKPVKLINTHCHVDHVLGNLFVAEKYGLELGIHKDELQVLQAVPEYGKM